MNNNIFCMDLDMRVLSRKPTGVYGRYSNILMSTMCHHRYVSMKVYYYYGSYEFRTWNWISLGTFIYAYHTLFFLRLRTRISSWSLIWNALNTKYYTCISLTKLLRFRRLIKYTLPQPFWTKYLSTVCPIGVHKNTISRRPTKQETKTKEIDIQEKQMRIETHFYS